MEVLNTNETLTAATGPTTLSTAKRLFNKNYLLLWQGQFISRLGSQVYSVVIGFWLQQTTQSGSIVGAFFMMVGLPIVFFGIFGGALADRISRKKIIVGADIINGLLFVTLGVVMYFNQHQTDVLIAGVFVAGVLVSSVGAFFGPAISASVPDLVPPQKIQAANSMGQFSIRISAFFGQGAGIPLLHLLGLPILVLVNGITYLVSAFSESFITIPQKKREKVTGFSETLASFKKDLAEGLRYIGKNKGLKRLLTISVFLNFFTMPIIVLLVFFVKEYLKAPDVWYGYLLTFYGIGALTGYISAGILRFTGSARTGILILFMILEPAGYILLTYTMHSLFLAAILFFVGGIFNGFIMVNIMTILQLTTPSEIRGRVFGALTTLSGSITPLGMGLGGVLYDLSGKNIALIYRSSGAIMIAIVLLGVMSKELRKFIAFDKVEDIGFTYKIRTIKQEEIKKDQKQIYLEYQLQKPRSEL